MSEHVLGDAPIEDAYRTLMNGVARELDRIFNGDDLTTRETGFVLLVFPMVDSTGEGRCNFISNGADRKDIVALFKEMIARFEGQPKQHGNA